MRMSPAKEALPVPTYNPLCHERYTTLYAFPKRPAPLVRREPPPAAVAADYTPYRTWIAEVMMQQTQMDRGVQYFLRWMERFPDVAVVAAAPEEDLLKAWEGLGYYRRARNIQAAARVIMERHGGNFPTSYADILALPGVGPYTAGPSPAQPTTRKSPAWTAMWSASCPACSTSTRP